MFSSVFFRGINTNKFFRSILTFLIAMSWSLSSTPVSANIFTAPQMPQPGAMVTLSPQFNPLVIRGIELHPENPLLVDFIVDTGDSGLSGEALTEETTKLAKYFLAGLAVPEQDLWVNLSPYESERIIEEEFGKTDMGRDLLAQDYLLKQITASLMYPEDETGKAFWNKVYDLAYQKFGLTDIPVDTFNKVWITPERAVIYQNGAQAYVAESHLKVQLEKDFLAEQQTMDKRQMTNDHSAEPNGKSTVISQLSSVSDEADLSAEVMREVIIPVLEQEVNEGTHFAPLRQIVNSMALADWYKQALKGSLLTQLYADQNKMAGIDQSAQQKPEAIYQQYVDAYKTGVYNYIKEEYDERSGDTIPRKYFSGGFVKQVKKYLVIVAAVLGLDLFAGEPVKVPYELEQVAPIVQTVNGDSAMTVTVTPGMVIQNDYLKGAAVTKNGSVEVNASVPQYVFFNVDGQEYGMKMTAKTRKLFHDSADADANRMVLVYNFGQKLGNDVSISPEEIKITIDNTETLFSIIDVTAQISGNELSAELQAVVQRLKGYVTWNSTEVVADGAMVSSVSLGDWKDQEVTFTRQDNRITITKGEGEIEGEFKKYGDDVVFVLGNVSYLIKNPEENVVLSDIPLVGNASLSTLVGEQEDGDVPQFKTPLDNRDDLSSIELFPANKILQPSLRPEAPEASVLEQARRTIGFWEAAPSTGKINTDNIKGLLDLSIMLGLHGDWKDYHRVQTLLSVLLAQTQMKRFRPVFVGIQNFLLLSYVGVDWKRWKVEQDKIQAAAREAASDSGAEEKAKPRTKTLFELPVESTRLPVDDVTQWKVADVVALGKDDLEFIPTDDENPAVQAGKAALERGGIVSIPFAGGSATTPKKIMGAHKMVHRSLKANVRNADGSINEKWISIIQARLGILLGQSRKARITTVTSVGGSIEGESDRSIRQVLDEQYPDRVANGQFNVVMQRVGPVLDNQTGYPLRFKNGQIAVNAENHLWAFLSTLMNQEHMLDLLKNTDGVLSMGNGDNVLNYVREGMVGAILDSRGEKSPIATVGVTTPSAGDRKGGIAVDVTYQNKNTGETMKRREFREISEFATRNKAKTGFSATDFADVDPDSSEYKVMDENGWFIEDLFEGKEVAFNVAFYAVDARLMIARIFGLDETAADLNDQLAQIDAQTWVDTIIGFANQVPTTYKPSKGVPNETNTDEVKGYIFEQAVQDFIINALSLLERDGEAPRADMQLSPRKDTFLPYKGTKQAVLNEDGTVDDTKPEVYDLVANQRRYAGVVKDGLVIVLSDDETVEEIIPVETLDEIIAANKEGEDGAMTTDTELTVLTTEQLSLQLHQAAQSTLTEKLPVFRNGVELYGILLGPGTYRQGRQAVVESILHHLSGDGFTLEVRPEEGTYIVEVKATEASTQTGELTHDELKEKLLTAIRGNFAAFSFRVMFKIRGTNVDFQMIYDKSVAGSKAENVVDSIMNAITEEIQKVGALTASFVFNQSGGAVKIEADVAQVGITPAVLGSQDVLINGGIYLGNDFVELHGVDELGMPLFDAAQLIEIQQDFRGLIPVPVAAPQPVALPLLSKVYDTPANRGLPTGSDTADRDVEPGDLRALRLELSQS